MLDLKGLINGKELLSTSRARRLQWLTISVYPELVERYIGAGWEVEKVFKKRTRLRKLKSPDAYFEDRVWIVLYDMGFHTLNKDRSFKITYDTNNKLDQQIDVLASDDETILIVECKSTEEPGRVSEFKDIIAGLGSRKKQIIDTIRSSCKGLKPRIKFILATKNFNISNNDRKRLEDYDIYHIDDKLLEYFAELTKYLGSAAKFQFLGNLFAGKEIPELDTAIPAVSGKLGGHTFYSFSIEPSTLLKFSYVLHRNDANLELMPTYQRMIKKSRLKSISRFLDKGGFFPNSIVVNIDNEGKELPFDLSSLQNDSSIARIGIVHLPKRYRSAYIIDGQHRLYGYTGSKYSENNTIPVVAFANLGQDEQLKIFMEINENQKSVPKNLRTTLAADLDWDSDSLKKQVEALETRIAQELGTDNRSPLYEKVIIGENQRTATKNITLEAIKRGIRKGNLTGDYDDTKILKQGTFHCGPFVKMQDRLFNFLLNMLIYTNENSKEFSINGFFLTNPGIESFLRVTSDIIDELVKNGEINPLKDSITEIVKNVTYYLDALLLGISEMSEDEKVDLKKRYGAGAPTFYLRTWQQKIHQYRDEFEPEGLSAFWEDNSKKYNAESFSLFEAIETHMKKRFIELLEHHYGERWFFKGIPKKVFDDATKLANEKMFNDPTLKIEPWDCLHLIDYRDIATYGSNWTTIFSQEFTYPVNLKQNISKDEKTKWMVKINDIRNDLFHEYSIKKSDYEMLKDIHSWITKIKNVKA